MAYSILLTILGTPVIFYGDEFGKVNDQTYYEEMYKVTNIPDSRYLARGPIDWDFVNKELENGDSYTSRVHRVVKTRIQERRKHLCFSRGTLEFVDVLDTRGVINNSIFAFIRSYGGERIMLVHNLSEEEFDISLGFRLKEFVENLPQRMTVDLLGQSIVFGKGIDTAPTMKVTRYAHFWIVL